MTWKGLGKVSVPSSGTPVKLSASTLKCNQIMVTFDPADAAGVTITVKDADGNIMVPLTSTNIQPVLFTGTQANGLDLSKFQVDSSVNGKGPVVAYAVE